MSESELHDEFEYAEEEISCEEVDKVLAQLSQVMDNVDSDTIHEILDEAYNQIFDLVYESDEDDAQQAEFAEDDLDAEYDDLEDDLEDEGPQSEAA